jgi:hypothetical protein
LRYGPTAFFDGDKWNEVKVEDPNGTTVLHVRALRALREFGATEQFNETNEPVMAELVEGFDELGPVEIVGFQVVVVREAVGGTPAPLVVFAADLSADTTEMNVPSQFLEEDASYTFEVLQIDVSGNQTIAESAFQRR